jgi:hypothetical protein
MYLLSINFRYIPVRMILRNYAATPEKRKKKEAKEEKPPERVIKMAVAEGQALEGLNIFAKTTVPIIMPKEQYPPWVWTSIDQVYGQKRSSAEIMESLGGDINKADEGTFYSLKRALKCENTLLIRKNNAKSKFK